MRHISLFTLTLAVGAFGCAPSTTQPVAQDAPLNGNGNIQGAPLSCPPSDLFEAAICVCEDFADVGRLQVMEGPSGIAHVGVNGAARFVNQAELAGDLRAYESSHNVADLQVGGTLASSGDVSAVGSLGIGGDLQSGGDLNAIGRLTVGGQLQIAGTEHVVGTAEFAGRSDFASVNKPCACDGPTLFDVGVAVAAAKVNNDNQAAGIDERLHAVGSTELRLSSGTYYLADATVVGRTRIVADGQVALYVEGDVRAVGQQEFSLEPGATLDLFVSGSVKTVGQVSAGSASDPQSFRLYVGGENSVALSVGQQEFFGSIYAPEAKVAHVGSTRIIGALFAKTLAGVGSLQVEYGSPVDLDPPSCVQPPDDEDEVDEPDPENTPEPEPEPEPIDDGPIIN